MQKNILVMPTQKCTGCSACQSACPTGAITMQLNAEGFYEPLLNSKQCLQCGQCLKTCPVGKASENQRLASFYGWHIEPDVLYNSTSGGAFRAFADKIQSNCGIVYGATYNDNYTEVLFSDSDSCDLVKFQKSKYIVSNPQGIYKEIKRQLDSDRYVLFSGTPCQVAGLTCFLNKDYVKLLTIDFVCGGMPSLRFWQEHVKMLEAKYSSPIISVDFRSKKNGWGKGYLDIQFKNGKQYFTRDYLDSYYHCFCDEHISVRNSCLSCEFHNKHFSDITIADFWGYANAGVDDVSKGVSLLVVNSKKGELFINEMETFKSYALDNRYSDYAIEKADPTEDDLQKRNDFFELAGRIGFENTAKRMCPATITEHIKTYLNLKIKK